MTIAPQRPTEWSEADAELLARFAEIRERLPAAPFQLSPGVRVADPSRFYDSLDLDIAAGPAGPRTYYRALQGDLQKLCQLVDAPPAPAAGRLF